MLSPLSPRLAPDYVRRRGCGRLRPRLAASKGAHAACPARHLPDSNLLLVEEQVWDVLSHLLLRRRLLGQMAMVGQEPVLYARSIYDNIVFGLPEDCLPSQQVCLARSTSACVIRSASPQSLTASALVSAGGGGGGAAGQRARLHHGAA